MPIRRMQCAVVVRMEPSMLATLSIPKRAHSNVALDRDGSYKNYALSHLVRNSWSDGQFAQHIGDIDR